MICPGSLTAPDPSYHILGRSAAFAAALAVLCTDVDAGTRAGTRALLVLGAVDEALLDVGGERVESLVDVDVALRGDLEEGNAEFVGELLALLGGDDSLLLPVALVSDEDLVDAFGGVLLDVGEPGANVCGESPVSMRSEKRGSAARRVW